MNPTYNLQRLFALKEKYLLPTKIHEWLENDLSIILLYTQSLSACINSLTTKSYLGGQELSRAFSNFIQFHTIDYYHGSLICNPIIFINEFNKSYWINMFEEDKKRYLASITPRSKFNFLNKLDDGQLEKLIEGLEEKELRILKDIFYPVTKEDKIALIIASINFIPIEGKFQIKKLFEDEKVHLTITSPQTYKIKPRGNVYILTEDVSTLDSEKFEALGISIPPPINSDEFTLPEGRYECILLGKSQKEYTVQPREYYLKQLKDTSRKRQQRAYENIAKDEQIVKIMKKNMPKLEELAYSQNMPIDKLVNKIIEVAYQSKNEK